MTGRGITMRAIRSFFRHIRDGFRNLFRNGLMTLVSIFTMTLTLIMIGSFVLIWTNINEATRNIEQTFQVISYGADTFGVFNEVFDIPRVYFCTIN